MNVVKKVIPDVLIIGPKVFGVDRGFFFESFNQSQLEEAVDQKVNFVHDSHSKSVINVLRGLHYQIQQPQGKRVVAADIRKTSPIFGQHVLIELSAENNRQFWIPDSFAHGFPVISDTADFLCKTTNYWAPTFERSFIWNDLEMAIDWPC